jgi:hypothetical protein
MVDDSTNISWKQVYKIPRIWVDVLILRPFIWSSVFGLMLFRNGSEKGTASNFVQISENVWRGPGIDWKEESMSRTRKVQTYRDWKGEIKVKSMLIIIFVIKGIVPKEFVMAGQTVNSA